MATHYTANNFVIRLRGLPWNTNQNQIQKFLQGCKIRQVQFLTNKQGRETGECFVVTESREDVDLARSFDKKMLSNRYIEVFDSSAEEMQQMTRMHSSTDGSHSLTSEMWHEPIVRLHGLPYSATKTDVIKFFSGLDIAQNGVHISSSKQTGEAFVAFTNMDNAHRALDFNFKNMGHRYIKVFKSNYNDARSSILNDTYAVMGKKSANNDQRQESFSPNNHDSSIPYSNNPNMQFFTNPPISNGYDSYKGYSNSYTSDTNSTTSMKRPLSVPFTIKMRGVPFEATREDIFYFFSPVVPIDIEQEKTTHGRSTIWYVEFGSREEATDAMTFDKKNMGTRYIELLPLYDDFNRSKMIRS